MRKRKATVLLAGLSAAALALAGCANGDGGGDNGDNGDNGGGDGGYHIILVSKGFQHQFWQAVQAGAQEEADAQGVTMDFDGPASETQVDNQLQMLQTAIDSGPDAIGYAALDPEACLPLFDQAEAMDIPIVQFDAACNSEYGNYLAATDGVAAGALAAENMAEELGGEGTIGVVAHSQINSTSIERRDGFIDYMEENHPDIEIVDVQYGDGDHIESADIARAMINANPDLDGLYGTNEGSAIGIVNAISELGIDPGEIAVVGFDSGSAQIEAIQDGSMLGAVTQDPMEIGRLTIRNAIALIEGEELPEFTDTGSFWYDADNIDDEDIRQMIYE
ncbi:ABC transporter substrate-binding protein [uncultured Agrococcus sp.]|uniref:ABC transporter substrate-binding protein n=1 Tax=uncultured Agrococcus sp. TaxID=382258 RepID=UPI0025D62930|nr:ABC transporter substrate-binding protein [uncultured Agrococcus sp.]